MDRLARSQGTTAIEGAIMNKKPSTKKLTLKREAVRTLTNDESKNVAGGSVIIPRSQNLPSHCGCTSPVKQ
jgi:hypothetical protein